MASRWCAPAGPATPIQPGPRRLSFASADSERRPYANGLQLAGQPVGWAAFRQTVARASRWRRRPASRVGGPAANKGQVSVRLGCGRGGVRRRVCRPGPSEAKVCSPPRRERPTRHLISLVKSAGTSLRRLLSTAMAAPGNAIPELCVTSDREPADCADGRAPASRAGCRPLSAG
jgi:hypothetical protein